MFTTTRANRVCKSLSFFLSFSFSTELLEDKQGFKLGGVDTSPSYLLFQTLLPLFWTLTCIIWMELTRTDAVFSRIAMVLFYVQKTNILGMTWNSTTHLRKNNKKSSPKMKTRGPTPCPWGWGTPPSWVCPPTSWAPWRPSNANSNSIYLLSRRKKSERKFHRVLRYGAAAKP